MNPSLKFNILFYGFTAIACILCLPCLLYRGKRREWLAKWWIGISLGWAESILGIETQIKGTLAPDETQPYIYASKHQSAWETMALYAMIERPVFVLKRELLWIPLFGWYLQWVGCVAINRRGGSRTVKRMIRQAETYIAQGRSLIIFPEGTRKAPGEPPRYRKGVGILYDALNVPVIPVALNSGTVWGRKAVVKQAGVITVSFLPPIEPGLPRDIFMRVIEERIEMEMTFL